MAVLLAEVHPQRACQRLEVAAVREVDAELAAVHLVVVHVPDGRQRGLGILELDEGEAAHLSRLLVDDHANLDHLADLAERVVELLLRRVERQVSAEDVMFLARGVRLSSVRRRCRQEGACHEGGGSVRHDEPIETG